MPFGGMNENLVWSSEGRLGKLLLSTEKAPSWRVLLLGADFVAKLVQRLQGHTEGTVRTTIVTALQTSEQAAFPRKRITKSTPPHPPAQTASVPRTSPLFMIIKQGPWQHTVMSWECEVINPSRGRAAQTGHNGVCASAGLAGTVSWICFSHPEWLISFSLFLSLSLSFFFLFPSHFFFNPQVKEN